MAGIGSVSGGGRLLRALLLVYVAFGLVGCLAPATGWDAGVYHFALSRLRAEEGWMVVRPDIPVGYRPASLEMLYTVGFLFNGEALASLVNFSFYLAGLGIARHWAGRIGGERAGRFAGLAFMTSTTYVLRMDGGDVEVGQSVYLALALYALWRRREGGSPRWAILAGLGLGLALGIKYSSLWAAVAVAGSWIAVRLIDRASPLRLLAEGVGIAAIAGVVAAPWYVMNALTFGNPFFPYLEKGVRMFEDGGGSASATWARLGRSLGLDGFILAALPAAFLSRARSLRWVAASMALFVLLVFRQVGFNELGVLNVLRYGSPAFVVFHVLGALGVAEAMGRPRWVRTVSLLFLAGTLGIALLVHGERNRKKVAVALGLRSREDYLTERINSYWAIREAERLLPAGKKVLLVEQRVYYCRVPFLGGSEAEFGGHSNGAQLRAALDRHAIGFLVVNHAPYAKTWGFRDMLARTPSLLSEARVTAIETRNDCTLYRVD